MPRPKEIAELPQRLFVIGDLHGCYPEISMLYNFLVKDQKLSADDLLVFIGDYIDRGERSRDVIELMLKIKREFPRTVFLKGNHEDMMLSFLGFEGSAGNVWIRNGGEQTLTSYDLDKNLSVDEIRRKIYPQHIEFLRTLDSYLVVAGYVFVHAGLNPLKPLDRQDYSDLYWIRDEFIQNPHQFGKTVVFGHTPYRDVLLHPPFKIGVDTGCVFGNKLTCLELSEQRIFQVSFGASEVQSRTFSDLEAAS